MKITLKTLTKKEKEKRLILGKEKKQGTKRKMKGRRAERKIAQKEN